MSSPFTVLVPRQLPSGAVLAHTETQDYGNGLGSVDLYYVLTDGSRLHVWETNRSGALLGSKAPSIVGGTPWSGSRTSWLETTGMTGAVLVNSGRIGGTLISVDGNLSSAALRAIANSVQ